MSEIQEREVVEIFKVGLIDTISTMTGFSISEIDSPEKVNDMAAAMILKGEKNVLVIISTNRKAAKILVAYMTGIDFNDIDENDLFDGVAEILNMTAGIAKSKLTNSQFAFNISLPLTINGDNLQVNPKNNMPKYEITLGSEEIEINLKLIYF